MNDIFRDLIMNNKVAVYLDDILIYSKTMQEHIEVVNQVLQKLKENDLYLKPEKCKFHKTQTEFLGLIISEGNIGMDPIKLKGVADWPTPRKLKDVQGFMGFANFYRRFIKDFSEIARPLNNLTKKDVPWTWDEEHEKAFQGLKSAFLEAPILKMPDPEKPYRMECDASNFATGAILSQQYGDTWHPVAYHSKSFNETERNYEIHDKELGAIIKALGDWQHYLEGQGIPVEIWTDHKNLEYFMKAQNITRRQARWALFLSRFDFTLHHKPGKLSTKPDALSRRPDHFKNDADDNQARIVLPPDKFKLLATKRGQAMILNERPLLKRIRDIQTMEDEVRLAVEQVKKLGPKSLSKGLENWNTEEGLLLFKGRIYVPNNKQLRADIVRIHHDGIATGHPGRHKTLELVSRNYWWPSMSQFINEYVDGCDNCLRSKPKLHDKYKQLKPNETPERRWGTISMDFIMPLPISHGQTGILVIVDRLTKMAHFCPVKKEITAMETVDKLMNEVFKHHGLPDKIISDRGTQFAAKVTQEMYNRLNITVALSTAYHPQTDGQTERVNQDLETYIRLFCNHRQNDWAKWLHLAEFAYNNKQHSTTKISPFMANNLSTPRWQLETRIENMSHPAAEEHLLEMKNVEEELKACLDITATKMEELYSHQTIPVFQEGDMVFLDAKNLKEKIQTRDEPTRLMTKKLRKKRVGPFKILKKIGDLNYQLELPQSMMEKNVHNVFHITLLTKAPQSTMPGQKPPKPLPIIVDSEEEMEVQEILDSRLKNRKLQYLVRWKDMDPSEDSWEPLEHLKNAPEMVKEFHARHPEAPRKINAVAFRSLPWKTLENYTLHDKKGEVMRILRSRDLAP